MSTLQKINLGTPPTAVDGDTSRVANTKMNANVDVLGSQAALTNAGAPITAAQALTTAHIGKRVNIALTTAGVINMPAASTCQADQVTLLRNSGTTVATLAITAGSGDTCALTKLNPGETALMDTDGVHAWTVLIRGRTNSDNEVVNGNCTVNGNETVTGALTAGSITSNGNAVLNYAPGGVRAVGWYASGNARWLLQTDGVAEGGSNAGSNLVLSTFSDAGAFLLNAITLNRATGTLTLGAGLVANSVLGSGATVVGSSANSLALYSNNAQRALIDASGGFHINEAASWTGAQFSVRNSVATPWGISSYASTQSGGCFIARTDSAAVPFAAWFFGSNNVGTITTNGSSTTYGTTSDYRLKTKWREIDDPVSLVMRIKFYEGEFKSQPGVLSHYVIAHELQEVLGYAVVGEKNAVDKNGKIKPQFVDYSKLVPILGAALQRQELQLRAALRRIAALEGK